MTNESRSLRTCIYKLQHLSCIKFIYILQKDDLRSYVLNYMQPIWRNFRIAVWYINEKPQTLTEGRDFSAPLYESNVMRLWKWIAIGKKLEMYHLWGQWWSLGRWGSRESLRSVFRTWRLGLWCSQCKDRRIRWPFRGNEILVSEPLLFLGGRLGFGLCLFLLSVWQNSAEASDFFTSKWKIPKDLIFFFSSVSRRWS